MANTQKTNDLPELDKMTEKQSRLEVRHRLPYNCRHTYATICAMSGMNPLLSPNSSDTQSRCCSQHMRTGLAQAATGARWKSFKLVQGWSKAKSRAA